MFSVSKPADIVFCCAAHILWWVHRSVVQPGEELPSVPHCDHTESIQMERWSHILTPTDLLIHCVIDISLYLMWFLVVFCDPIDSFRLIQFPAAHLCVTRTAWILLEPSFSFKCCVAFISPSILILTFLVWQPDGLNFSGCKCNRELYSMRFHAWHARWITASVSMCRAELHELCSTWGMEVGCSGHRWDLVTSQLYRSYRTCRLNISSDGQTLELLPQSGKRLHHPPNWVWQISKNYFSTKLI